MLIDKRLGDKPRYYQSAPADWNMRVPDEIRKCVVFLGTEEVDSATGELHTFFCGTAYVVVVPNENDPRFGLPHLVTVAHVARSLENRKVIVRVNLKEGKVAHVNIKSPMKWWSHPTDETIDVAVTPFTGFPQDTFDCRPIETDLFLTDEIAKERGIGTGDEVFVTGLFSHFYGDELNVPIVRVGHVAMMPHQRVPVGDGQIAEGYLIDARSVGGLSGSPVFVRSTAGFPHSGNQYKPIKARQYILGCGPFWLMGHIWGHLAEELKGVQRYPHSKELEELNMGITVVIPAVKILETINHPEFVQMRKDFQATRERGSKVKGRQDSATIEPTQRTREDFLIPIPKKSEVMDVFRKATRKRKPAS